MCSYALVYNGYVDYSSIENIITLNKLHSWCLIHLTFIVAPPENSYLLIEFDVGFQRNVMGHYMYKLKDNFEDIIRDETRHAALTYVNI